MRVFVTGATGAIGRHAVDALVGAGHDVSALARSADKAAALADQGATPVTVSLFETDALASAFDDHETVANLATAIPPTARFMRRSAWEQNERIRTEGSAAVVNAAIAAGVDRVIQESVVMLYPDCGTDWINEDTPPDGFPIAQGNLAAEANAQRFTASGGPGIVLRFGWFHGPGAAHCDELLDLARRHIGSSMGPPDSYVSSIHVADAGRAVEAALRAPAGTYNVTDDEPLTKREFARALVDAVGTSMWLRAPGRSAALLGDRTTSLTRSVRASNRRFKQATSWAPTYTSAREGLAATVAAADA